MKKIEIDDDVFSFLQKHANPLIDSPNQVLRRLLFGEKEHTAVKESSGKLSGDLKSIFIQGVVKKELGKNYKKIPPNRFMYESADKLIYLQNFDKSSVKLWYRINKNQFDLLKKVTKKAFLGLTNPADKFAYIFPIKDIEQRIKEVKWTRDYLEANIDYASSRWVELDWRIEKYLRRY
ncbi:MAG: hypothetical protein M0R70_02790 [Nitrospirae bacterium]|nr:hypothetical protein [Nitrospirota bacterium]